MRLSDVDTGGLSELKYKLICCFKLAADMVESGIREFVNDTDGQAFLERELMGLGVDGYGLVRVHDRASGPMLNYMF